MGILTPITKNTGSIASFMLFQNKNNETFQNTNPFCIQFYAQAIIRLITKD